MSTQNKRMRVFHVEDSTLVRTRVQREIERIRGIELVGGAAVAADAIDQIQSLRPDILILDLELAGGNGMEILREFRGEAAPVSIILTNHADAFSRSRCLRAGAHYFFDKSVDFDAFISLITGLGE